jgi:hypothetical protein
MSFPNQFFAKKFFCSISTSPMRVLPKGTKNVVSEFNFCQKKKQIVMPQIFIQNKVSGNKSDNG